MKWLAVAILVAATLVYPTYAGAKGKILFFDLEAPKATRRVAKRINASLRTWVSSAEGLSSTHGESLAESRQLHCTTPTLKRSFHACLARIGSSQGADQLVIGSVLPSGKDYRVVLTIVDTRRPKKTKTTTETLSASSAQGTALESWIRKWFKRLFAVGPGFLIVSCNLDSVFVRVNKKRAGYCGKGVSRLKLSGGKHRVSFARAGYVRLVHWVEIRRGETLRLKVALRLSGPLKTRGVPRPATPKAGVTPAPPKRQRPAGRTAWRVLFFSTLGTGAALMVASIFTALKVRSYEDQKLDIINDALNNPPPGGFDFTGDACANNNGVAELVDVCNKGHQMSMVTNVLLGVGTSLVLTSAVFLYFAYFAKAKRPTEAASVPSTPSITVTPQVWRSGGGLLTTLRF